MKEPTHVLECDCGKTITGYSDRQLHIRTLAHKSGRKHQIYSKIRSKN